jgi:hypothetical protein
MKVALLTTLLVDVVIIVQVFGEPITLPHIGMVAVFQRQHPVLVLSRLDTPHFFGDEVGLSLPQLIGTQLAIHSPSML